MISHGHWMSPCFVFVVSKYDELELGGVLFVSFLRPIVCHVPFPARGSDHPGSYCLVSARSRWHPIVQQWFLVGSKADLQLVSCLMSFQGRQTQGNEGIDT